MSRLSLLSRERGSSSSRILNLGGPQGTVAEMPAEILRRTKIDLLPPEEDSQLGLHRRQPEQARVPAGLELDQ